MTPIRFTSILTALTLALGIGIFACSSSLFAAYNFKIMLIALFLSYISTLGVFILSYNVINKSFKLFMYAVLGSMIAKMALGIFFVILVGIKFKPHILPFVATYFFSYFLFTSFEVWGLMRNLRPFSKKDDNK